MSVLFIKICFISIGPEQDIRHPVRGSTHLLTYDFQVNSGVAFYDKFIMDMPDDKTMTESLRSIAEDISADGLDDILNKFNIPPKGVIIGLELRQAVTSGCRSSSGSPISRAPIEIRAVHKMNELEPVYVDDFEKIRQIIEQARQEAIYKVNETIISLYWNIGKFVTCICWNF